MDRRRFVGSLLIATGAAGFPDRSPALGQQGELRIGLTAVAVREYVRTFAQFRDYLTLRMGRPVRFVQRRSYADIMDMLSRAELEAAWICGYPYVKPRDPEYLDLLVAPVYGGAPLCRSLVIVPSDSPARRIDDLRGKVFAYSDPDSNSGYLAPRAMLAGAGYDPERYFRLTFFTYSHVETVVAVADQMADGGAVDSYVYNLLKKYEPGLAARTRLITASRPFGFPPIVVHRNLPVEIRTRLLEALVGMEGDPKGAALLNQLDLDGFAEVAPALYDTIRQNARKAALPHGQTGADAL